MMKPPVMKRMQLLDLKTDIFLSANVLDALLTYFALQEGSQVTEMNGILSTVMDTIGTGTTLFLKIVLCVAILWILKKTKRDYLLVPLSVILVLVAISNLVIIRLQGIEV